MVGIINGLLNIADRVINNIGVRQLAGERQVQISKAVE
jgi:hypothetical protein